MISPVTLRFLLAKNGANNNDYDKKQVKWSQHNYFSSFSSYTSNLFDNLCKGKIYIKMYPVMVIQVLGNFRDKILAHRRPKDPLEIPY